MSLTDLFKINDYKEQIDSLSRANAELVNKLDSLDGENYFSIQGKVNELNNCFDQRFYESKSLSNQIRNQFEQTQELDKQIALSQRSLLRIKELYKGMQNAIENYIRTPLDYKNCILSEKYINECERLNPVIKPEIENMNKDELYMAFVEKQQLIDSIFQQYSGIYETASDKAIYELTVSLLKSEIQNLFYELKPNKLDDAIINVKYICRKTLQIASEGNTNLAGNYTKMIGELEYHYTELVSLRYEYLVKINFPKSGVAYQ